MADEDNKKEEEGEAAAPAEAAQSSKSGLIVVIIVGFLVMILTPVATLYIVKTQIPAQVKPDEKLEPGAELVLDLEEPVMVNISGTKGTRVLRIRVHIVVSEKALYESLSKSIPLMRDRIMRAASREVLEQLDGETGKMNLKRQIRNELNAAIKDRWHGAVTDVYFSEFLIQ